VDSITHIVLGGCIGEVVAGKKIGKKAIIIGAAAQSLPDIDVVASLWLSPASDLLAHRGFTHSILFALLASTVLGWAATRWLKASEITLKHWSIFFGLEIVTHLFLDAFNAYGTGWFEPFSHIRVSFNMLFVADPFLSAPVAIGFLFLLLVSITNTKRNTVAWLTIVWCGTYLTYAGINKAVVDSIVRENLTEQKISYEGYFSTPTPLNSWLWYVVASNDSGNYISYRSVFDRGRVMRFEFFDRGEALLSTVEGGEDVKKLRRFSQGFYSAELWGDTLVFNDHRFGQMIGWKEPRAKFVFHYFLNHPHANDMIIQRGRFKKWDDAGVRSLIERIKGD